MNKKDIILKSVSVLNFYRKLIIITLILPLLSGTIKNDKITLPSVKSNSLNVSIAVKTNVECFTCLYSANLSDSVNALFNNENNECLLLNGKYLIPVKLIDCQNSIMNNDMQDMLNVTRFPLIQISVKNLAIFKRPTISKNGCFSVSIDGIDKEYSVAYKNYLKDNILFINGTLSIDLNDFNISPPSKFFGLVKVNKVIDVNFDLKLIMNNNNMITES